MDCTKVSNLAVPNLLKMKTNIYTLLLIGLTALTGNPSAYAQNSTKGTAPLAAVLHIDTKGLNFDPVQMGNLVRVELEKTAQYRLIDRYDLEYLIEKNQLNIAGCYGAICLSGVGKVLALDYILSGSVELAGDMIITHFRLINVRSEQIERSIIRQYLNIPKEVPEMVSMTLKEFFELPVSADIKRKLTKQNDFDNLINNPTEYRLASDGPRMGFTVFTGTSAARLRESQSSGGYEAFPMMFQFGYQFEKQYLNEGRYQALFEFIPMITGIDQQLFIPSLTIMNGFRDNYKGWEIAFGPTFSFVKSRKWAKDAAGNLYDIGNNEVAPAGATVYNRLDSRGLPSLTSGFIIAFGRTFKSGHMNLPINGYVIPSNNGARFGLSFGFNAKNKGQSYTQN
jgi:hypothetical protein